MLRHHIKGFDVVAHRAAYRWAGKLVQLKAEDPYRLTSLFFDYRDWQWVRQVESANGGRQLHGSMSCTWRWERPFYKYFGDDWQTCAVDKEDWYKYEHDFLEWRYLKR